MKEQLLETSFDKEAEAKQDHCGLVAYADFSPEPNPEILPKLINVGANVENRGQSAFGIKLMTKEGIVKTFRTQGLISDSIESGEVYTKKKDHQDPINPTDTVKFLMIQCRYGTSGGFQEKNIQPCTTQTEKGDMVSVIHNGEFVGKDKMKESLNKQFSDEDSDTYVYTHFLAAAPGDNWDEKIINTHSSDKVDGFFNEAIMAGGNMYLVRDKYAGRPFMYGKVKGGGWIAASEDSALKGLEIEDLQEVGRGQIIRINEDGPQIIKDFVADDPENDPGRQTCLMEYTYTTRHETSMPVEDNSVFPQDYELMEDVRYRSGVIVGRRLRDLGLDYVAGIPRSGIPFGKGLAVGADIRYEPNAILINENYKKRVFQNDEEWDQRNDNHLKKLKFQPEYIEGFKVGAGDDSSIRGDAGMATLDEIWKAGAKEAHLILGLPQMIGPCHLGISTRTYEELISFRNNSSEKAIAAEIGATSVTFIQPEEIVRAILGKGRETIVPDNMREIFKENGFCGGCITGLYPVDRFGNVYKPKVKELAFA
jgi:amidophosphoribosyltransferase